MSLKIYGTGFAAFLLVMVPAGGSADVQGPNAPITMHLLPDGWHIVAGNPGHDSDGAPLVVPCEGVARSGVFCRQTLTLPDDQVRLTAHAEPFFTGSIWVVIHSEFPENDSSYLFCDFPAPAPVPPYCTTYTHGDLYVGETVRFQVDVHEAWVCTDYPVFLCVEPYGMLPPSDGWNGTAIIG